IEKLGRAVTKSLSCSALAAVLHDDDVLYLWLFQEGRVFDRYDSLPQYFDPEAQPGPPEGGNAKLLCAAFDRHDREERVGRILRAHLSGGQTAGVPGGARAARRSCCGVGYAVVGGRRLLLVDRGWIYPQRFPTAAIQGHNFRADITRDVLTPTPFAIS